VVSKRLEYDTCCFNHVKTNIFVVAGIITHLCSSQLHSYSHTESGRTAEAMRSLDLNCTAQHNDHHWMQWQGNTLCPH